MRGRALQLLLLVFLGALPLTAQAQERLDVSRQARPLRGLQGPIATLLTTGEEGGGLPVAVFAGSAGSTGSAGEPAADGRFAVPLLVEIGGHGLLAGRSAETQRVDIYAYAMGADGTVHDFLAQGLTIDLARWGEAVLDRGIKFVSSVSMPAGTGSVRLLVVDPDTLRYSLLILPVTVPSPPSADTGPLRLHSLFSDSRGPISPAPSPMPDVQGRKRQRNAEIERRARQGYEEAVRSLASGTPAAQVVDRLAEIETGLYAQAPQEADALREVELETAKRLGKFDPEALLPLTVLHAELYRKLRGGRSYLLTENARRTCADLIAVYAERGGSATIAAQALLSLAADLLASGVQASGRDLLGRALTLDSRGEAAGLFLAASYERDGDYPKAVEILEGVVRSHPESFEARLRLSVNLDRVGRTAEARQAFQTMISEPGPDWVRTIAYQEMVRLHLRNQRPAEAVALLKQAVARLPGEPQLRVQLAFLLDRQGSAGSAREILDRLRPASRETGGSPRHRYGQWPAAALEEARRSLTQQSLLRLAALSRALNDLAGKTR